MSNLKLEWVIGDEAQPIRMSVFDELATAELRHFRLGVGMTITELEATLAVLNWILKTGAMLNEVEHARDGFSDLKMSMEGRC